MHPSIVPGRPVADHEVSASMPLESSHCRDRHAPLLSKANWLKTINGKYDALYGSPRTARSTPNLVLENYQHAKSPPVAERKPRSCVSVDRLQTTRRPQIPRQPQVTQRPQVPQRPQLPQRPQVSQKPHRSQRSLAPQQPRVPERKASLSTWECRCEAHLTGKKIHKPLPAIPAAKSTDLPRVDYGPLSQYTALSSHPASQEERKHSARLRESRQNWRENRNIDSAPVIRVQDQRRWEREFIRSQAMQKQSQCKLREMFRRS